MPRERNGERKSRRSFSKRSPDLGYYFIATDAEKTEKNYFDGLRESLPEELRDRIVIKVSTTTTENLISACEEADIDPQYRQCWIVFDRDRVEKFDQIIEEAERKDIKAGWSNPCIEIWFYSYLGRMPAVQDSVACCKRFAEQFEKLTGHEYEKSNPHIYEILNKLGKEENAINIAERRYREHLENDVKRPSQMCPCTTVHHLVDEIRRNTGR